MLKMMMAASAASVMGAVVMTSTTALLLFGTRAVIGSHLQQRSISKQTETEQADQGRESKP